MVNILERLLQEKTTGKQSEILYAQWKYDKRIVPDALQSISALFPHYSLHDESHSITIVNNIVRVIGEDKLELLSAIDIWLILEASYWHDMGMVVSHSRISETVKSREFTDFFRDILSDSKNTLFEFANLFDLIEGKFYYKNSEFSFEYHDGFRFLLAEYFRRIHASRSKDIVVSPDSELHLTTPRGVIPERINRMLGEICACHTKNFEDVLKLPFKEVGIDTEDAHPRFVSCLLRIGDLLDLDNNRFSDVMLRTLSKVPLDTINHKNKHLAIQHFRVDNHRIEVTAKCKGYDVAAITQHWFNYIHTEFSNQMINWNRIVPGQNLGYLPSVGELTVELEGYEYIDGRNKPKFVVDSTKALELLSGTGIYESQFQAIREVLQNSIDATLQRMWLDHKDVLEGGTSQSPKFKDLVKDYEILVEITERASDNGYKIWDIKVRDKGIGLSVFDLKFLVNTGTSFKNSKKNRLVEDMPKWLQPSGIFGIGFQSIFMLTDKVELKTKSYFTEESKTIELFSPKSNTDGAILIQRNRTSHKEVPGTTLSFLYSTPNVPSTWDYNNKQSNVKKVVDNYDPFVHNSMDVDIAKLVDEIIKFSEMSYIPIKLRLKEHDECLYNSTGTFQYYDLETDIELNIFKDMSYRSSSYLYFKNQRIKEGSDYNYYIKFLAFDINIHGEKATDALNLSRNTLKKSFEDYILKKSLKAIYNILLKHFNEIFPSDRDKQIGSLFLHYHRGHVSGYDSKINSFSQWEGHEIFLDTHETVSKRLGDLKSFPSVKIRYNNEVNETQEYFKEEEGIIVLQIPVRGNASDIQSFIILKIFKEYKVSKVDYISKDTVKEISLVKVEPSETSEIFQEKDLQEIVKLNSDTFYYSRLMVPCLNRYEKLRVKNNSHINYTSKYHIAYEFNFDYPIMMSPFVRESVKTGTQYHLKAETNDQLFQWVFDNRFDTSTTIDEIKESYSKFVEEFGMEINGGLS